MRSVLFCGLLVAWLPPVVTAGPAAGAVTIVLDFRGAYSGGSVREMMREFEGMMKDTGLRFDWRLRADAAGASFDHLVVVRFKGKCVLEPVGYLYDERGPLAFTYSSDSVLQPFSEVECDKVTATVRSAMWGGDYSRADILFGRALARVVAHELVHLLSQSRAHGNEGVAMPALSGRDLISADFGLSRADRKRVHPKVVDVESQQGYERSLIRQK